MKIIFEVSILAPLLASILALLHRPPPPSPPPQREVRPPLESNPYEMIRSINFKPVSSYFQKKLVDYINNFKLSENLIISADKTANLYEMTPEQYKTTLINK